MDLNESLSIYSDTKCEHQKELGKAFVGVLSTLIPFVMLVVPILNELYNKQKGLVHLLKETGNIMFNDHEFELVGFFKVIYCTVFSLLVLYLILAVVIILVDKNCSLETIPYQLIGPLFTFYGLMGYGFYYADQSIVSNIRSIRGIKQSISSQGTSHLPDGMNCKSYIRLLLETDPGIVFKYKEYHLTVSDDEVVDVDINKEFNYTRCDDVTCPTQFEDIENKIDKRKPVILETIIDVVCGDEITKTKFSQAWYNFASMSTNRTPQYSDCVRQMEINSCKREVMLFWCESQNIPWWMTVKWYRTFTFLLLAIPYRILFGCATQRLKVRLKKIIYC